MSMDNALGILAKDLSGSIIETAAGRALGYAEYGPADGWPVLAMHGTPGSRLEHGQVSVLQQLGVRWIVIDRPGYGLSDFQPDRQLLDWVDDVTLLADELALDRFAVLGFSGGGAYAAACACKLQQRISQLHLISSIAPLNIPVVAAAMHPANLALFTLAANDYRQVEQQLAGIANNADALMALLETPAPAVDKAVFAEPAFRRMYLANMEEALQQGAAGLAYDMALLAQPWGFDVADIAIDVTLWHGQQDINAPPVMAEYLAERIPACTAHMIPEAGHYLMFDHWQQILQFVVDQR